LFSDLVYRAVILGALLHDIGKLLQRGSFGAIDIRGQHPQVSADFIGAFRDFFGQWVDADLLRTLVQRHHENSLHFPSQLLAQHTPDPNHRGLALLVSKADNLSSSERGRAHDQYQDFRTVPLASVFRSVEVAGKTYQGSANFHAGVITTPDSLAAAFPADFQGYAHGEYNQLITAFGEGFNALRQDLAGSDFSALLSHLLNLLFRYGWCIPANTQEDSPDVSLYDHLRTSCAIAACLYQRHKGVDNMEDALRHGGADFILAAGDVSGIQSYIFSVAHVGEGGVARRLRARSLMVQLVTEAASRTILERLDLPPPCQIMGSGGNFFLLLPNTSEAEDTLGQVGAEMDRWALEQLHGELTVHLSWTPLTEESFRAGREGASGLGQALARVSTLLSERKQQRFAGTLKDSDGWNESASVLDVHYEGQEACPSCRRFPQLPGDREGLCRWCRRDQEVGARLPQARLLQLRRGPGLAVELPGWSAEALTGFRELQGGDVGILLNQFDLSELSRREASARFLANYIPKTGSDGASGIMTFEEIAEKAKGRTMLAFLKMDVDKLGELMVFGLKRSDASGDRDTMSRLTTLSRLLDAFFNGWVHHLLESRFEECYTVFSGGDDLFIVGPWDQALDLAQAVREDFHRWTGRTDITISAGLVFTQPHYPLALAREDAEGALKRSKNEGRDRITVLGETRPWPHWQEVWSLVKILSQELDRVPTAALYRLREYGEMWRRWRDTKDPLALRYQPLLAYSLAREGMGRSPRLESWAQKFVDLTPGSPAGPGGVDDLGLVAQLLILRKGR
jgi:CRISPR-associated protein Csm1